MAEPMSRRDFLRKAAWGSLSWVVLRNSQSAFGYQANEKLNMAFVGAGGRGGALINEFAQLGENVVALCDCLLYTSPSPRDRT